MSWQTKLLVCLLFMPGCQRSGNKIDLQPGQSATISQYGAYDVIGCDWLESVHIQPGAQAVVRIDITQPPRPFAGLPARLTSQSTINGVADFHERWQVEIDDARKRIVYRGGPLTRVFDFGDGGVVMISDADEASDER